jgi:hypothetical protein
MFTGSSQKTAIDILPSLKQGIPTVSETLFAISAYFGGFLLRWTARPHRPGAEVDGANWPMASEMFHGMLKKTEEAPYKKTQGIF